MLDGLGFVFILFLKRCKSLFVANPTLNQNFFSVATYLVGSSEHKIPATNTVSVKRIYACKSVIIESHAKYCHPFIKYKLWFC